MRSVRLYSSPAEQPKDGAVPIEQPWDIPIRRTHEAGPGIAGLSSLVAVLLCIVALVLRRRSQPRKTAQATATILGQVTDESGAALPGVTVTLKSPALQVPSMTTITDERGEYRLTPLPIGIYTMEYELSGFQTLRLNDIRLTAGFTAKLDQSMKIGTLAETVTVSGQTPLVDVTQASTATTARNRGARASPVRDERHRGLPGPRSRRADQYRSRRLRDHRHEYFHLQRAGRRAVVAARGCVCRSEPDQRERHALQLQCDRRGASTDERQRRRHAQARHERQPHHQVRRQRLSWRGGVRVYEPRLRERQHHSQAAQRRASFRRRSSSRARTAAASLAANSFRTSCGSLPICAIGKVIREIPFATRPDGSIIHRPQHQFFQAYKVSGQLNQTNKLIAFWHRYGDHEKRSASQFVPERAMEQNNAWGETWKARMAGDDRPVHHAVGAARAIRTRESVPGLRPRGAEEYRHHDA